MDGEIILGQRGREFAARLGERERDKEGKALAAENEAEAVSEKKEGTEVERHPLDVENVQRFVTTAAPEKLGGDHPGESDRFFCDLSTTQRWQGLDKSDSKCS